MTDAIDIGEFSEALNDKMDRDGRNADTTSGADVVIAYQEPTAANNYTWYRLYKSGWVEQGGFNSINEQSTVEITLLIEMSDTNYIALAQNNTLSTAGDAENGVGVEKTSTTKITMFTHWINPNTIIASWEVKGMSA